MKETWGVDERLIRTLNLYWSQGVSHLPGTVSVWVDRGILHQALSLRREMLMLPVWVRWFDLFLREIQSKDRTAQVALDKSLFLSLDLFLFISLSQKFFCAAKTCLSIRYTSEMLVRMHTEILQSQQILQIKWLNMLLVFTSLLNKGFLTYLPVLGIEGSETAPGFR